MTFRMMGLLAVGLLALAACSSGEADAEGTQATTQTLLEAASSDAAGGTLPPGVPRAVAPAQAPPSQEIDIAVMGVDRGRGDAPVRIIEFSDYGCGYCRKFHLETWPTLARDFIEPGKVEWKFLPYVSGMFKNSPTATLGAECALAQGEVVFEAMNGRLWEGQGEWKGAADPVPVVREMARAAGADMARYEACMGDGSRAWRVDAANALARQVGVRATPTFFVVGYPPLQGALPTEAFVEVLNMVHADATKGTGGDR